MSDWLISWQEDGQGRFEEPKSFTEAKEWLLCNGDVPNFQPVLIHERLNGALVFHTIGSFLEVETSAAAYDPLIVRTFSAYVRAFDAEAIGYGESAPLLDEAMAVVRAKQARQP